jgi:hypothetical protein
MANRTTYPSASSGLNQVFLNFELLGAGAAPLTIPAGGAGASWVTSVTRTSAGLFVVTLKDSWNKCIFKSADMDDTLNDGSYASTGTVLNEGTATPLSFQIFTRIATGVITDPAAARRIGVSLCLRNGVPLGGG